ncbi:unnamed protein product [Phytophthora fragariaefolia]|uniref:Unnamed protein product n=1 Tax=Phytophthora fragariaefolia TaxID=1490495 RepID=A0A9W6YAE6_9STRA|nr:unnamed protein product [Phytophthora fragariaefolia]
MDITELFNNEGAADWKIELSDEEDAEGAPGDTVANEEEAEESDNEARATDSTPPVERATGNAYIDRIIRNSGLHIVREREGKAAYRERRELGLFVLFFTREFRDSLQSWTNKLLKETGRPETTVYELDAYIGLEIVMSFNSVTGMKEPWSQKLFMGQADFGSTMARNRFEAIRARFQVHSPGSVPVERREQDPRWHSWWLLAQIQAKFAAIAVPIGAVSLDENTVRTKARSSAKTTCRRSPISTACASTRW